MHLVNWETIIAPVYQGVLGILDLRDTGKTLVAKWIYSYCNNKDALWRKVVCDKSKGNPNSLLLALGNTGNKYVLLDFVDSALGQNDRVREVIKHKFKVIVGDGYDAEVWSDNWMGVGELKCCFPRILRWLD